MNRVSQSGNVFFIIFLGIALFAALGYAVSGSMRNSGDFGKSEKNTLLATDIISYGNTIATAVKTEMALNGCKDTQITFEENNGMSKKGDDVAYVYTNPNSPIDKSCHIFSPSGGGVTPRLLPKEAALDVSVTGVTGMHPQSWQGNVTMVKGVGTDGSTGSDLILLAGKLDKKICIAINDKLGVTNPGGNPPNESWDCRGQLFSGTYMGCSTDPLGDSVADIAGRKAFCIWDGTAAFYIQVLLAR